jgi:hypothetical protein
MAQEKPAKGACGQSNSRRDYDTPSQAWHLPDQLFLISCNMGRLPLDLDSGRNIQPPCANVPNLEC